MSILDKVLDRHKAAANTVVEIPILLRFWEEEGVWNGEAVDLPVAVFGRSFEETTRNLQDAVISHLETLKEIGTLKETVATLRACARQHRVSVDEMALNQPMVRFDAGLQDCHVVAIA